MMELLFESRTEIIGRTGKIYFFQRQPTIHPAPVLEPDSFVDGAGVMCYGTVLRENGIFRMWYNAWPRDFNGQNSGLIGYAESDDGVTWRKPILGLMDYAGKGTENNLINLNGHAFTVFIDPDASDDCRYRATMCTGGGKNQGTREGQGACGYYTAHSADGLKWAYDQPTPQWNAQDVINCVYHPGQKRAIVALKVTPHVNGIPRRSIWNAEFRDGRWSEAHAALLPDEYDDIAAGARGFASGDYYGMGMMPAGSGTVGFLWQFRHRLPRTYGSGIGIFGEIDVTLAYQAARGDRWLHVPGRPDFISNRDPGFGRGVIYTASCPILVGDEQWLYFNAYARSHAWYLSDKWQNDDALLRTVVDEGLARIGIARWPKWRVFGWRTDPQGTLTLKLDGITEPSRLLLNYECEPGGSIRISLEDVPERTEGNAIPLTGSRFDAPATWRDGAVLAPPPDGKPVVVTLHMDRASVYAYQVIPVGCRTAT